ncbi:uncharacterized protein PHACADRAFT_258723 [Phanerochaete carnosa HHB-10118-sp]|uniref:Arrestin C-terminal-like domain-containing protein n=1 Tax=Phanerochaete carnosa (strain HHB-10118-sp) TaxID=650164 RepID=K5WW69_PHACS|nr:uncharacterized protein PHACADRAFT_258723 [Phanerochaete carnosa HHB-10118-sp]EKM54707.1 hypothetical protein PHACADRAFT_258723 [Phanerochaete carnosa HHB-10118-sp]
MANESLALNSSPLTYIVCNHEWSFLEGAKSHAHTLKAGRHLFPFQLHIGGSLPSSVSTSVLGGASVHYKLRASVVRPGFAGLTHRDLHAVHPVTILRGFSAEALEYQQTLEIENTWPEKLMYSIMIPHKAWAAGDRVAAVAKFSPLAKGASVKSITATINETVKLTGRAGSQESTRAIATAKHEIHNGQAVCVEEQHHRYRVPLLHHSPSPSPVHTPSESRSHFLVPGHTYSPGEMTPLTTVTTNSSSSSSASGPTTGSSVLLTPANTAVFSASNVAGPSTSTAPPPPPSGMVLPPELEQEPSSDVVTTLQIAIPVHATPAHSLEPIHVNHRIRWSIMITNMDGHVSELRCSLPLHILDHRLYDEARANTLATRRLLLGARDVEGGRAVGTNGEHDQEEEDAELPSYPAHVRDRVANAYIPETAVMRVTNPWVHQGISPVVRRDTEPTGMYSPAPLECFPYNRPGPHPPTARSQLPPSPGPDTQQLHWVNSELLLSLGQYAETPSPQTHRRRLPVEHTPPESAAHSRPTSRPASRPHSRHGSRAASPMRSSSDNSRSVNHASTFNNDATYVHSSSSASRNLHGLFHMSMKPFTSLTSGLGLGHRAHSHAHLHGVASPLSMDASRASRPGSGASTPLSSGADTPALLPRHMTEDQLLLHRAFIETPDYEIASRGFLGGGIPPLSSYAGLPSYEEAAEGRAPPERSLSDTDLAARMPPRHAFAAPRPAVAATAPPSPPP